MRKVVVPLLLVAFVGGIYLVPAALNARSTQLADAWDVNTDLRAGYAETPEQAADRLWQHVKKACLTRYEQLGAKHAPLVPAELDVPGAVQARNAQNAFLLTCHMTERVERLCIPAHKAKMVRLIRGHFHNIELDGSNLADAEAGLAAGKCVRAPDPPNWIPCWSIAASARRSVASCVPAIWLAAISRHSRVWASRPLSPASSRMPTCRRPLRDFLHYVA